VSLASGDPIGDPEAWPGAIEPWLAEARARWIGVEKLHSVTPTPDRATYRRVR